MIKIKNTAYGRHRISRPMRIVAQIFLFPLESKKRLIAFYLFFYRIKKKKKKTHPPLRRRCRRRRRLPRGFLAKWLFLRREQLARKLLFPWLQDVDHILCQKMLFFRRPCSNGYRKCHFLRRLSFQYLNPILMITTCT